MRALAQICAAASFLIAGGISATQAVDTSAPIHIYSCLINNSKAWVAMDAIYLTYSNQSTTQANEVRFRVMYEDRVENIVDRGYFSRGAKIEHWFRGFGKAKFQGPAPQQCFVTYVHFVDGSTWPEANRPSSTPSP